MGTDSNPPSSPPDGRRKRRLVRASDIQNRNDEDGDMEDPFAEPSEPIISSSSDHDSAPDLPIEDPLSDSREAFYLRETMFNNSSRFLKERDSDEGEDLFGEDMEKDYTEMPHLDHYSSSQLDDDTEYTPIPLAERLAIDAQLERRDRERLKQQARIPDIFLPSSEDMVAPLSGRISDEEEGEDVGLQNLHFESRRAHRQLMSAPKEHFASEPLSGFADSIDFGHPEDDAIFADLLATSPGESAYSLTDLIGLDTCRRKIAREYRSFLTTFLDPDGHSVYSMRIREMCATNSESLHLCYLHLAESSSFLARMLLASPREVLKIIDEITMRVVLEHFPEYDRIRPELHVRLTDLPTVDLIRDLRRSHLNGLVRVMGVVVRRSPVFPQLKLVKMDCLKCGAVLGPFTQELSTEIKVNACSVCDAKGPFRVNDAHTIYRNFQKITIQEVPGSVPAGRLPRSKEAILLSDLIDSVRPGDEIELTGIYCYNFSYQLNTKHGFPVFSTVIEANCILRRGGGDRIFEAALLTEEEIQKIRTLATDPQIGRRIIASIAPSIFGHEDVKMAIALAMFGGVPKSLHHGRIRLRGDINVLLLGDPGCAKSQFLKYVNGIAPRSVYATGQGASAVGLTASVRKDPATHEWTLEGGSLVLADKGICLIDEFDKMNDADRTSIHEAMEQQSISISKAGIVTSLQARCSVIAAANPIRGRYISSLSFGQNVDLSEPILSRFDILCVIRDPVDPENDARLASFVISSHARSHPEAPSEVEKQVIDSNLLSQDMLKNYLTYARSRVSPMLRSSVESEKIARVYAELRKESLATGGIPMTVRHVESMVRMAEAHARMHLREEVLPVDVNAAIRTMLSSFISSQKYSVSKRLSRTFAYYLNSGKDTEQLLLFALQELLRETMAFYQHRYSSSPLAMPRVLSIDCKLFLSKAKALGAVEPQQFFKSDAFLSRGFRLGPEGKNIIEIDNPLWVSRVAG